MARKGLSVVAVALLMGAAGRSIVADELPVTIIGNYPAFPGFAVGYFIDNNYLTDYASAGGGNSTYVDFDFGSVVNVGSAVYTDRVTSGGGNGSFSGGGSDNVLSYRLIFSNDASFSTVVWSEDYLSPGFANTDPPALVNGGSGVSAEFVRWQVTVAAGGNPGGAEIHFFSSETAAVPEPWNVLTAGATVAAALAFSVFRRRGGLRQGTSLT